MNPPPSPTPRFCPSIDTPPGPDSPVTPTAWRRSRELAKLSVGNRRPAEVFGDLHPDLDVWRISDGRFSFSDVAVWALDYTGAADAVISTWSIGSAETLLIKQLLYDGRIRRLRLLCDHAFRTIKRGQHGLDSVEVVRHLFEPDQFRTLNNHAKGAVLAGDERAVAWITSANLNQNPRAEIWALSAYRPRVDGVAAALEHMWSVGVPASTVSAPPNAHAPIWAEPPPDTPTFTTR